MGSSIGHTFMYNVIIIFIVIVFGFLAGIMSYYKAFKINNAIVYSIEKYEGYNDLSRAEIDKILNSYGYDTDLRSLDCSANYKGMSLVTDNSNTHRYCIYVENNVSKNNYFSYGVKTYMTIQLPVVNLLRFPVFTKTNQIYKFTKTSVPKNF